MKLENDVVVTAARDYVKDTVSYIDDLALLDLLIEPDVIENYPVAKKKSIAALVNSEALAARISRVMNAKASDEHREWMINSYVDEYRRVMQDIDSE